MKNPCNPNSEHTMKNFDYVREVLHVNPGVSPEAFVACMRAMERYSFPWWLKAKSKKELAAHQLAEPILLVPWADFKAGVQEVLKRSINDEELTSDNQALHDEFNKRYLEMLG